MSASATATLVGTGRFVWHELMARDPATASTFYTQLLGWNATQTDMGGMPYTIFDVDGTQVAGLATLPPGDTPTFWMGYVSLGDVDAALSSLAELGGQVYVPAMEVEGIGRFGVAADPQGAVFGPFSGSESEDEDGEPMLGSFMWCSLMATDVPAAIAFYTKIVGWEAQTEGGMTVFTKNGEQIANVEAAQPGMPAAWLLHVRVADLAASRDKVPGLGGQILMPQVDVPGIGSFAVVQDPNGGVLSLFQSAHD